MKTLFIFKYICYLDCLRICCICTYFFFVHIHKYYCIISNAYFNSSYKMVVCRVYFPETPVQAVKEHDRELNKLEADALIPAMPGHVLQAFTLLKSSSEAQVCNCNTSLLLWLIFSQLPLLCWLCRLVQYYFWKRYLSVIECVCYS
jgi:hypothetical protein